MHTRSLPFLISTMILKKRMNTFLNSDHIFRNATISHKNIYNNNCEYMLLYLETF